MPIFFSKKFTNGKNGDLTPILPDAMPPAPCAMQCINRIELTFLWNNPGAISLPTLGLQATSQDPEIRCLVRKILKCLPFSGKFTNLFQWPEPRRGRIGLVIDSPLCLSFL